MRRNNVLISLKEEAPIDRPRANSSGLSGDETRKSFHLLLIKPFRSIGSCPTPAAMAELSIEPVRAIGRYSVPPTAHRTRIIPKT